MSFRTLEQQNAAMDAASLEIAKRETLAEVYAAHPTLIVCERNTRQVWSLLRQFAEGEVTPTYELFSQMLAANPGILGSEFLHQTMEKLREQIISEYLSLLVARTRQDEHSLAAERSRLQRLTLPMLRDKLAEIKNRRRMSSRPLTELKALVGSAHDRGFPEMPKTVWDGNQGKHVPLNAAAIKKMQPDEIRRLDRLYGRDQVQTRLNG